MSRKPQRRTWNGHSNTSFAAHGSIITALRVNEITDRDTFVNMFDSEKGLSSSAADLGANMSGKGPPGHCVEDSESGVRDEASNGRRRPCT